MCLTTGWGTVATQSSTAGTVDQVSLCTRSARETAAAVWSKSADPRSQVWKAEMRAVRSGPREASASDASKSRPRRNLNFVGREGTL